MTTRHSDDSSMPRRQFLKLSAATVGAVGALNEVPTPGAEPAPETAPAKTGKNTRKPKRRATRSYNSEYSGENLNQVAFPLGGIGAGMMCLEGTGAVSSVSLRNRPEVFNEPTIF